MSEHDIPLTDDVPEEELEAEPDHIALGDDGEPIGDDR